MADNPVTHGSPGKRVVQLVKDSESSQARTGNQHGRHIKNCWTRLFRIEYFYMVGAEVRRSMPIRAVLQEETKTGVVFDPDDVRAIVEAYETALQTLKVHDRGSAMGFLVARTIIRLAKEGERDPNRLSENVIRLYRTAGDLSGS
jgi:hypothetical protein